MTPSEDLLNAGTGLVILILIILANFYQSKIMRRFSGIIGKVMFWYSIGLVTTLVGTIFEWIAFTLNLDFVIVTLAARVFAIVSIAFFLKGARVIR